MFAGGSLVRPLLAVSGSRADDDFILFQEAVGNLDGLAQRAAGIVPQVQNQTLELFFIQILQGVVQLPAGGFGKAVDLDISNARLRPGGR
jgi:hypothetical protein